MSRWTAVSDFDYADEIGSPVPRMTHAEKPRRLFKTYADAMVFLKTVRYCALCDLWMAARTCKACGAATEPAAK